MDWRFGKCAETGADGEIGNRFVGERHLRGCCVVYMDKVVKKLDFERCHAVYDFNTPAVLNGNSPIF